MVGPNRDKDDSDLGFKDWTFSTVRCWGESPVGTFQLFVRDKGNQGDGLLRYWKLTLYGSAWSPKDVRERRIEVENSYSGEFIDPARNFSLHCPPGESLVFDITTTMSDRTLKLIALMSGKFLKYSQSLRVPARTLGIVFFITGGHRTVTSETEKYFKIIKKGCSFSGQFIILLK